MEKDIKQIETRTMWMVFYPCGNMMLGSQHYTRKSCLKWADRDSFSWKQQYKEGYRCKKVEVAYKEL